MADIVVDFAKGGRKVALIVRGKLGPDHHPGKMAQHADVILSDGSPSGYFGEGNSRSSNTVGLAMQGAVYDYAAMWNKRPYYVDLDTAVVNGVVSTVLILDVTQAEATRFDGYWRHLAFDPGTFNIVGGNCSTNASDAFIAAGILKDGIPWLDTPDNLYGQLVAQKRSGGKISYTGYLGFRQKDKGRFDLVVRPYVLDPRVNVPDANARPGSLRSGGTSS